MTPEGFFFASLEISTEASVCPALTSTPPSFEIIGKICPGDIISVFLIVYLIFKPWIGCMANILDSSSERLVGILDRANTRAQVL